MTTRGKLHTHYRGEHARDDDPVLRLGSPDVSAGASLVDIDWLTVLILK
jgi:hypothetical protein